MYYSSACNYGQIDNLTYTYPASTNRLASIIDSAPVTQKTHGFNPGAGGAGYTYDANGNLKTDSYKGITNIAYNHLNLPNVITFSSGNIIEWIYDAAGMKLRKIVKQGATVQYEQTYAGGLEYRKNGTGSNRVEAIYHAEGRYLNLNAEVNNTLLWQKEYALRDHLGNTRMMFADKNANGIVETPGEIVQENHYYPFGLGYEGPWLMNDAVARDNKYQYNGIENNDDFGLNWNFALFRTYSAAIATFGQNDPLIEVLPDWSPYHFSFANPISFNDPLGLMGQSSMDGRQMIQAAWNATDEGTNRRFVAVFNPHAGEETGREQTENGVNIYYSGAQVLKPVSEAISPIVLDNAGSFMGETGTYASYGSSAMTTLGELKHSGKYGLGVWRSENGKFYPQTAAPGKARPFYGNQHTGSINKAKAIARPIKIAGTALGVFNYTAIADTYLNGNMSNTQLAGETTANTISTFGGIYGVAFGLGWEGGRAITGTQGYQRWKENKWLPFRKQHFGY